MGYTAVLTAHTATDLAETVLLQAMRGGGIRALCGIPPVRELEDGLFALRPLLALTQEEVLAALDERVSGCLAAGLGPDEYARAVRLKEANTIARKILRLAVKEGNGTFSESTGVNNNN
jgi:hypothetical protein